MKIRTILADDEPLARERLRKLLAAEPDIELVAECADGKEAAAAVRKESPDLLFLDVRMPELDGFGVVAALEGALPPALVFVTAYDKFALQAFEVHALDYLLKPFDKARFKKTLDRVRAQLEKRRTQDLDTRLQALLGDLKESKQEPAAAKPPERIAVKSSGKVVLLKIEDIDWIEAADNYVIFHIGNETHMHRETMSAIETRLPSNRFMRISRSIIVNTERIKELQPLFHGDHVVILRNGTKLTLSRNYREKLDLLLGKQG